VVWTFEKVALLIRSAIAIAFLYLCITKRGDKQMVDVLLYDELFQNSIYRLRQTQPDNGSLL
jgi:hypothetical protein